MTLTLIGLEGELVDSDRTAAKFDLVSPIRIV
jgi:hypothetical protein